MDGTRRGGGPGPGDGGPDGPTVEALGLLAEALETTHRARGALYAFHQLTGSADVTLGRAAQLLREAGHPEAAGRVEAELVGRDVVPGHWTYQLVEAYDDTYWEPFGRLEREVRGRLAGGVRHLHEAAMRAERRTHGHPEPPDGPGAPRG
jgi:hypothetical protein